MKSRPIVPRAAAVRDADDAIAFYLREAGLKVALSFIEALERAYGQISRAPGGGSPRYAQELELPGLRSRPLKKFPHVVFYVEREDHVDVWRVLHGESDIPAWLREQGKV